MNFNMELTTNLALIVSLFAAFFWGSWSVSIKFLGDYPLDGYFITLFTTSFVFVWGLGLILKGKTLLSDIQNGFQLDPHPIIVTFICGILYVVGMRASLHVIQVIGLSVTQPIQSSVIILFGTLSAGLFGGIPIGLSIPRLAFACILLFVAVISTTFAGYLRTQSQNQHRTSSNLLYSKKSLWKSVALLLLFSPLYPTYIVGISYGLVTKTHPSGLPVMPFMAVIVTGALIGAIINSGIVLTVQKKWMIILHTGISIHKFGIISGLFHYGGNILHALATTFLSAVVSAPLGLTAGLWTQVWGLVLGEFKGAKKGAILALFSGIFLYLVGAYLIATLQ